MYLKKHPSLLFLFTFFLCCMAALSASDALTQTSTVLYSAFNQAQWYLVLALGIFFLSRFSLERLYQLTIPFYIGCLVLVWLLAIQHHVATPIIPYAMTINGATAWYHLPYIGSLQPSEFLKCAHILLVALMIERKTNDFKYLIELTIVTLLSTLGILLQGDAGILLLILVSTIGLFFDSHLKWGYKLLAIGLLLVAMAIIGYFIYHVVATYDGTITNYRIGRILGWLYPEQFYETYAYQAMNARLSFQSAGLFGHGFQSIVFDFPEASNDFIFAVILMNFGFAGGTFIILLFGAFILYLVSQLKYCQTKRDEAVIIGFTSLLLFQVFYNTGMIIGLLPVSGFTLPFISYGGSSLLSYIILWTFLFLLEVRKDQAHPQRS